MVFYCYVEYDVTDAYIFLRYRCLRRRLLCYLLHLLQRDAKGARKMA